jgi:pyruvate/2-oxoglutarate dehydrogenase complex dihydrolipoamide acyltransferase (E2) component
MKKTIVTLLAVLAIATVGCQKKEEAAKPAAPPAAAQAVAPQATPPAAPAPPQPQAAPQPSAAQAPAGAPAGADPHAGLKLKEMAPGSGHKGKVLQVMDAGSYTYLEVEEKGKKLWVAALKANVSKGETVEFPDSKPMENFQSKSLNKTFDKIIFADSLKVVK